MMGYFLCLCQFPEFFCGVSVSGGEERGSGSVMSTPQLAYAKTQIELSRTKVMEKRYNIIGVITKSKLTLLCINGRGFWC